ncbi:uncharacterized protein LOC132865717 [Neoarius graeffei]|uniref:uncharacterized protein LOC132865717 n=1 Tax=Neoarius graeffei TaxID=443677 RepID=UPI00298C33A0|nr:uncharacterized protein LOC132865717 [Neoarius graeffei]
MINFFVCWVALPQGLYGIDVLGIQEHRIVHEEAVINGSMLITTSATRNQAGAAVGGVGILLSSKASSSLAKVTPNTERIFTASFQGHPATAIIVTYCPTNTADEDIVKAHYDDLVRAIEAIPDHNLLLVVGDFNARIRPEDDKFTFHKETNRNGRQLLDLASEKDLVISSTYFRKKAGKLWTFISPGGIKYQLSLNVLIRRKWHNSMLNVEAYNSFASVGSDHRIVSARVRLSLRKKKAEPRKRQYDWNLFKSRRDIQELYTIAVHNRFQPIQELDESATGRYERFIKATEAAEKVVPIRKRERKTRHSEDSRVTHAKDKLNRAYERYKEDTTVENRQEYSQAKKKLKETYIAVEEDLSNNIRETGEQLQGHQPELTSSQNLQQDAAKQNKASCGRTSETIKMGSEKEDRLSDTYSLYAD